MRGRYGRKSVHSHGSMRVMPGRGTLVAVCMFAAKAAMAQSAARMEIEWPAMGSAAAPLPRLVVPDRPELRLGSAGGPEHTLFSGILGLVRLPNGHVLVGDEGNKRVVYFDSAGGFVRSIGRSGGGPGEFRQPRWFGQCIDGRLAVQDGGLARLTFLSAEGAVLGGTPLPPGGHFGKILWCSGDKKLIMLLDRPTTPATRGSYIDVPVVLVHVNNAAVDTIAPVGVQEYYIGKEIAGLTTVPFGRSTVGVASTNRIFACSTNSGECVVFDTTGKRLQGWSLGIQGRTSARGDWTAAQREYLETEPARVVRSRGAQLLREIRPRRELPLFDQMRVDHDGNVWFRTMDNLGRQVATWAVFSPSGIPKALVAVKRSFQVVSIGRDHLLGFERDVDGVEFVELLPFDGIDRLPP